MSDTKPNEQKGWTPEEESQIAGIMESTGCKRAEAIRKMRSSAKKGELATVSPKKVSYKLSAAKSRIIDSFIKFAGKWWKDTEELLKRSVEIDAIFDAKPRGVEIRGCTTKEQFYDKYTGISLRRIQQLRKAESTPVPAIEEHSESAQLPETNQTTQPEPGAEESGQPEKHQPHHLNCEHGIELSSAQNGGCPHCAEDTEQLAESERRHKQASDARKKAAAPRLAPPAPTPGFAPSPADIAANDLDTNVEVAVNWVLSYKKFMTENLWHAFVAQVVEQLQEADQKADAAAA